MEVDWYAKGNFQYTVKRGCKSTPAPEACYGGGTTMIQYKDCSVSCDPTQDGAGCNNGLDEVAVKFSTGGVYECYQCQYMQLQDGSVNGFPKCGEEIGVGNDNSINTIKCPLYADTACYWSASFHVDYAGGGETLEDDYRGCSTFEMERTNTCETADFSGM
jgi:hypothetical protein